MKQKAAIRVLAAALVFLATWWLFHLPAISNPIWIFCTTGVLPIVHRTLAPDAVMKLSIGLAVVGVMLVFRREIIASMPAGQPGVPKQAASFAASSMPIRHPLSDTAHSGGTRWSRSLHDFCTRILHATIRVLGRGIRIIAQGVRSFIRVIFVVFRRLWIVLAVALVFSWQAIEPYCRLFDRWLDKTLHRNKTAAEILEILEENWKTIKALYRKFDSRTRVIR